MNTTRASLLAVCFLGAGLTGLAGPDHRAQAQAPSNPYRGALLLPSQATPARLLTLKTEGRLAIALALEDGADRAELAAAAERVKKAGLELDYWIEVGRCPKLADAHPEWMASLQGHPEWRRRFPQAAKPGPGEVIKNYPWVPVHYRETFDPHFRRVRELAAGLPAGRRLFLNDLQGAPSACGCGNQLCRWTTDYGQILTATPLGPDAAALFVRAVQAQFGDTEVVPIWATECEEHERQTECAGVACYGGACWNLFTQQLMPLAEEAKRIGVLLPYRLLGKNQERYGPEAGWVKAGLELFREMPPKRKGKAVPASRLLAVLQGWDTTPEQVQAQQERAREAGAAGELVSYFPINQAWEPRLYKIPPGQGCAPPAGELSPLPTCGAHSSESAAAAPAQRGKAIAGSGAPAALRLVADRSEPGELLPFPIARPCRATGTASPGTTPRTPSSRRNGGTTPGI